MKNKKILFIILFGIIVALCVAVGTACGRTYELTLPQLENLESISFKLGESEVQVSNNEEMEEVLNTISAGIRTTKNPSVQDVNVVNPIQIDFNFNNGGSSRLFVYEKNNKNYVEQPYNGIYTISTEEYNLIKNFLK